MRTFVRIRPYDEGAVPFDMEVDNGTTQQEAEEMFGKDGYVFFVHEENDDWEY